MFPILGLNLGDTVNQSHSITNNQKIGRIYVDPSRNLLYKKDGLESKFQGSVYYQSINDLIYDLSANINNNQEALYQFNINLTRDGRNLVKFQYLEPFYFDFSNNEMLELLGFELTPTEQISGKKSLSKDLYSYRNKLSADVSVGSDRNLVIKKISIIWE